jgi:hypothetical protein
MRAFGSLRRRMSRLPGACIVGPKLATAMRRPMNGSLARAGILGFTLATVAIIVALASRWRPPAETSASN